MPFKDLTGKIFGRLTVIQRVESNKGNHAQWSCKCRCGGSAQVIGSNLSNGNTRSCGCLQREHIVKLDTKHGHAKRGSETGSYRSWKKVLYRCLNTSSNRWGLYGGAGVTVVDRWNPKAGGSFENFIADMGERPPGTAIGRFGDTGNYEPGNCAWQTRKEHEIEAKKKRAIKATTEAGE